MDRAQNKKNHGWKGFLLPLGLSALWLFVVYAKFVPSFILPGPDKVWKAAVDLWQNEELLKEMKITLFRVAEGFLVGSTFGFLLGAAMGTSKTLEKVLGPAFHLYRQVPLPGWIPILVIAFGNTEFSKVFFVSMGAFPPMAINTYAGIRSVSQKLVEVGEVLGLGRFDLFWKVVVPGALPSIWTGFKVSLNLAWMFVIAAELMTYSSGGLGSLLEGARDQFRIDIVIVVIVLVGVLGFLMNWILEKTQVFFLRDRKFR